MNQKIVTHDLIRGLHLFLIAALLALMLAIFSASPPLAHSPFAILTKRKS